MKDTYFVADDLDEVELIQNELMEAGVEKDSISVWSGDAYGVDTHHLKAENELLKTDAIPSMRSGLICGLILSGVALFGFLGLGLMSSEYMSAGLIFCGLVIGFCTWEAGLLGLRRVHRDFTQLGRYVAQKKHIIHLHLGDKAEKAANKVLLKHPAITSVRMG
ncbi:MULTISPECIES: hypothetical protein [unclassified Oleiphilus]|nr:MULTISPECIES: hypothetical protein [unclassified Oleiphilus]KZY62438.1 hypothetical protein A3738_02825 [Oleiphilus sp. HI0066]KZY68644.1 hypothetical protein A3739_20265 [Oleiphilus sp. HI0067]KZY69778.1 hypothetical protein A3739_08125 [Oleiphilus sp. HI0067]